ncbi:MAG: 3-deoxy-8-phosphooctulonate synthase [Candidatus Acididesulfobacter diazotrophicus]|jgi:2-dehydro-3-deoxyphosphooctonate aldolase (KDO 8-P synthase)|uniref:3-deoxy-8-phosphooctulonate synthase n=1 Tax=Candidatus Acididesulfobacter diazotrophicus TaxID=2597226 RepID=A0A519BP86_9DELT|nr:MAG: 3-deoxy-8-phosphooctulonate synthase [Candidatus Acididesulfobacter diazotrophicus]
MNLLENAFTKKDLIEHLGFKNINKDYPFIIAGPCVIESFELVDLCASFLKKLSEDIGFNLIFKASYDKANRTSIDSFRGPRVEKGIEILAEIKSKYNIPVLSDVHRISEIEKVKDIIDIIQIPAFLSRQTDLIVEASKTDKIINIKKGQFLAPWDAVNIIQKIRNTGNNKILLTERGVSFGYNNLVVDFRSIIIMKELGVPVVYDATHSVQLPGGSGSCSSGDRKYVIPLAKAAAAVGADGLFFEVHPDPPKAKSDSANSLYLSSLEDGLKSIFAIAESAANSRL